MAHLHCKRSKYLNWQRIISRAGAFSYLLILIYIGWVIFIKNQNFLLSIPGIFAIMIMLGPITWLTYRQYRKEKKMEISFEKGLKGEGAIYYELKELGDEFVVFQDVLIGQRGNTDFIVVGPTGIFAIEVKNISGKISFSGDKLLINEKETEKDFISQTLSEALAVGKFLKEKMGREFFVYPVLVFSSFWSKMHFGLNPVKNGVYVIQKRFLRKLIHSFQDTLTSEEIKNIESCIALEYDSKK